MRGIAADLDVLERDLPSLSPRDAEVRVLGVLAALLGEEGFTVRRFAQGYDGGVDLVAELPPTAESARLSILIQYKHYLQKPVGTEALRVLTGAASLMQADRFMLITGSHFTKSARELAARELPAVIELLDFPALRSWVARIGQRSRRRSPVIQAITDLSRRLARLIAEAPESLSEIEWRDLERVLAAVFEGIGFRVELTPGSKDKGRDIILRCRVAASQQSYAIEVKHWRSGKRVGKKYVRDFVNVVAREEHQGGVFVSSSGYSEEVEALTEVERQHVQLAGKDKIIALCSTYKKSESGIWSPPDSLPEVLFGDTL
jgi:HJR/Mrr/RecB family endonuclease